MFGFKKNHVTTPTILQMEATECGAAALGIILHYYGLFIPLEKLRVDCGVSRDGSKAINMVKAARRYGMNATGAEADIDVLMQQKPPFIVFWHFDHFVVIEGMTQNKVYLNDPASGRHAIHLDEFKKLYTGVVLMITPGPKFKKKGKPNSVLRPLLERLKGTEKDLVFIILASLALVIPNILISGFSKVFIDNILLAGQKNWLPFLLLGLFTTACLRGALSFLERQSLLYLQLKSLVKGSVQFLWHVFKLPMLFFDQRYAGDLEERIGGNDRIATLLSGDLSSNIVGLFSIFLYVGILFFLSWKLTLIGIVASSLNFLILYIINRQIADKNFLYLQNRGKLSSTEINGIQSIETLKSSALEDQFFKRWAGLHAKTVNLKQKLSLLQQLLSTLPTILKELSNLIILGIGSIQIIQGELTVGTLVAFQSLLTSFNAPLMALLHSGSELQEIKGDLNRLADVLNHPEDSRFKRTRRKKIEVPITKKRTGKQKKEYTLEFKNVTFGYSPLDPPLIENLSFTLYPGKQIALVGTTGSGKSTIAKLATGLYNPWEGEILLNNQPFNEIPREELAKIITFVDQDIFLFEGTVANNLTLWAKDVPTHDIESAIDDACIQDTLKKRSNYLDTPILERGINFSGGERQRLDLARALVGNPKLIVLDEATASLDAITEAKIIQNIKNRGLGILVIAHRLSTIRDSDEIFVLDKGIVTEQGTHEELKTQPGLYQEFIAVSRYE